MPKRWMKIVLGPMALIISAALVEAADHRVIPTIE